MSWLKEPSASRDALTYPAWRALITGILGTHDGPRDRFAAAVAHASPRRHAATAFDEALALTARIRSGAADCTPLGLKGEDFARRIESEHDVPPQPPTSVAPHDYLPRTRPPTPWETPPMPAPDFDFTFRPDSYWDPADPVTAIVANITGELRRNAVRAALEGDPVMAASIDGDEEALADHLSEERRTVQGAVHPWAMGGEYLPPYLPGEVEIARISMMSVTMDVIALRARRHRGRIHYRVVDEYEGMGVSSWGQKTSARPLTFRQLVRLIDSIRNEACEPGQPVIEEILDTNLDDRADLERMEWFITVSSEFYPQLQAFYERRAREWCERKRLEWMEHCEDCGVTYDPNEEDHDCPERRARIAAAEHERAEWEAPHLEPFLEQIEAVTQRWRHVPATTSRMGVAFYRARAAGIENFLRCHVISTGSMPSGVHRIRYSCWGPKEEVVDFGRPTRPKPERNPGADGEEHVR